MAILTFDDVKALLPGATQEVVDILLEDIHAEATAVAPCLDSLEGDQLAQAKAILRQALVRWWRAGDGGITTEQQTAGPFTRSVTVDSSVRGEGRLLRSELDRLRKLCGGSGGRRQAFTVMPTLPRRPR